jgi:hypothetical protein
MIVVDIMYLNRVKCVMFLSMYALSLGCLMHMGLNHLLHVILCQRKDSVTVSIAF